MQLIRRFEGAEELEAFAAELSLFARPGMAVMLSGDVGSGKSTFARAFIRALAADPDLEVPSPTFTLVQTYEETRVPVAHADLYRIRQASDVAELGLDDLASSHVLLVEWPDKVMEQAFAGRLLITLSGEGSVREATLVAAGSWAQALFRNADIRGFLAGTHWSGARRRFLEGDASFRRYETLEMSGDTAILMDMPARPDGPPVRNGKPYSAIAHLAEDIRAVIAVNAVLCARGYSAPLTYAQDLAKGLAVVEDLGRDVYGNMIRAGQDMREPMLEAVAVLAHMAGQEWPEVVPMTDGRHVIARYDIDAQLIEVDLLPSWFWPHVTGSDIPVGPRAAFDDLWRSLLPFTQTLQPVWVLRDYHSPNLIWLPGRQGRKRVGLIDTQDCLLGHPAYDLASLLQDARTDISFEQADELHAHYCDLRQADRSFDRSAFDLAYAILGAQRATKILGIFARLSKRDGKHGYLRHVPRVSRYLERNLSHPKLAGLKAWFDAYLPLGAREER
ncbi:tRNA (adenosine(37)-N6)-threonylcarbamoyltransferase complex ATPase subunit type 1 TsaE [Aestuariivirga sp.]|jgi:tRNA threonylcarbamoyl adenosine modification protein YjeE|uniref:tRNA (adenosine(37)-N6)-threonylcarbamoyltransferase complex ATPase subunit type 1 TsaE n=1 Tax=Aestuariivirga sp. TaxID=2650926 RepID=UPI0037840C77